jgi:bifunctional oligoribonuclease and PAP phosphatase NrnA
VTGLGPPTEAEWDKAVAVLAAADRGEVVLAGHVSPDADAVGSMLALAHALRRRGTRVLPSFSAPYELASSLTGLPGIELLVPPEQLPAAPALLVTLDTGSADRLGSLDLVDPAAAATAVLTEELVRRLGVELDREIAACLYAGLVTDTGSFRFSATTPETHELAARLLRTGIRHDLISRQLLDTHPAGWLGMVGAALARARLEPAAVGGFGLVWTDTRLAELDAAGLGADQAESVIDLVRTAAEAEVAMVCKQATGGGWTVSMRSKGRIDVSAAAVALGGGGHRFAAGFSSDDDLDATVAAARAALAAAPQLPG